MMVKNHKRILAFLLAFVLSFMNVQSLQAAEMQVEEELGIELMSSEYNDSQGGEITLLKGQSYNLPTLNYYTDSSYFSISKSGVLKAKNIGSGSFYINVDGEEQQVYVYVNKYQKKTEVQNQGDYKAIYIKKGKTLSLAKLNQYKVLDAQDKLGNNLAKKKFKNVATVTANGKISAKGSGKATIGIDGLVKTSYEVKIENMTFNNKKVTIYVGDTANLTVSGTTIPISWYSKNPTIVSVNQEGKITALNKGTAKIVAVINGKSYTLNVTSKAAKGQLSATELYFLNNKKAQTVAVTGTKANKLTWTSTNTDVVTVTNGKIKPVGVGQAEIQVRTDAAAAEPDHSLKVFVYDVSVVEEANVSVGGYSELAVDFGDGNTLGTYPQVLWSSAKNKIATVSPAGVIHGVKSGTSKVTATVLGKKLPIQVTVTEDIVSTHVHDWIKNSETGMRYCEKCGKWSGIDYTLYSDTNNVLVGTDKDIYVYLETKAKMNGGFELKNVENGMSVATLKDDGNVEVSGDDMTGDGIYTVRLNALDFEKGMARFVVECDGYQSNICEVLFYEHMTEEELQVMESVNSRIETFVEDETFEGKNLEEKKEEAEDLLEEMAESEMILAESMEYDEESTMYSFKYSNGVLGGILLEETDLELNSGEVVFDEDITEVSEVETEIVAEEISEESADAFGDEEQVNADVEENTLIPEDLLVEEFLEVQEEAATEDMTGVQEEAEAEEIKQDREARAKAYMESRQKGQNLNEVLDELVSSAEADLEVGNALVLNAFPSFETDPAYVAYRTHFYETTKAEWDANGLTTTLDTNVTVSDFQNFEAYDVICVSTHGTTYTYYNGYGWKEVPAVCVGEKSTKVKDSNYEVMLKDEQIAVVNKKYVVLPRFFERQYEGKSLNGAFVFFECCESFGYNGNWDYSFADALIENSASGVIGWNNSVMANYCRDLMKEYVDGLVDGYTSGEAFDLARDKHGYNDAHQKTGAYASYPVAVPGLKGDLNKKLWDTGLLNGDFEKSDMLAGSMVPANWLREGDVRTVTKLGDVGTKGNSSKKMGIITSGIGSKDTFTWEDGTEGSLISQTFIVPLGVTDLAFDYNFVSEEPMEWVDSEYDDSFGVIIYQKGEIVCENILESINSSMWYTVGNVDFADGDDTAYQTGWKKGLVDISEYAGSEITLSFIIYDKGDSAWDSAALLDNVVLQ